MKETGHFPLAADGRAEKQRSAPVLGEDDGASRPPRTVASGQGIRVLVVDDEDSQRRILAEIVGAAGYQVDSAKNLGEALERVKAGGVDTVVTDLRMPGGNGIELLEAVRLVDAEIEVILMTAFSGIETAVEAMRKGAYSYLPKPFEKDELLLTLRQVREKIVLRRKNRELRGLVNERFQFGKLLGASRGMQDVYRIIEKVHSNSSTVLIRGESGTGKELVARAVHSSGTYRDRPFVAINCAAIPETLIESELFGHEKGAFTGALAAKVGRFEEVEDGTLFLDEIGSMQHDLQAKLLRVIQEKEFQRLGGSSLLKFGGRIVAATSQDLEKLIAEGRFREDLFYRLNVVPIELPALRERAGDLALLACHFLRKYTKELGKNARSFSPEALDLLEAYDWPGNVRELENVVQRIVVLADDAEQVIDGNMIPGSLRNEDRARREASPSAGEAGSPSTGRAGSENPRRPAVFELPREGLELAALERELIQQALERTGGKLEPASRLLGISYKTLQYRIKKYAL